MESGKAPQKELEGQQSSAPVHRPATFRELNLLSTYLNEKYHHQSMGRWVETPVAKWSREQLEKSLKSA